MSTRKTKRPLGQGIALIVMALSVVLIIWSLWPPANNRQTLTINPEFIQSVDRQDCPPLNHLQDYDFELVVPRALWKAQSGTILLTLRRNRGLDGAAALTSSDTNCSLALETRLLMNNLHSQPGDIIVQPFVGANMQSFMYTISPLASGQVVGKLWVYALVQDVQGGDAESLPLFAIPMELPVWTIFGLPPALVRYLSLLVLLILLALQMRRRLLAHN
jgi:hypothetical protein